MLLYNSLFLFQIYFKLKIKKIEILKISFFMTVIMTTMAEQSISNVFNKFVFLLSEKYNFDHQDALEFLNLQTNDAPRVIQKISTNNKTTNSESKKSNNKKIPIPFCYKIIDGCCHGIRLNHGLFTQCSNEPTFTSDNGIVYCGTCQKQANKNSDNKPTYGTIQNRIEMGDSFRDPKGKHPIRYANIMEKLNITRSEAETEATRLDLIIPEIEFEVKKLSRGRPKKDTSAKDSSDDDSSTISTPRPRGRPRKVKKEVVKAIQEFSETPNIKDTEHDKPQASSVPSGLTRENIENKENNDISDTDSEAELSVTYTIIEGKKYLKADDNTIYDCETHDEIGIWCNMTGKIILE